MLVTYDTLPDFAAEFVARLPKTLSQRAHIVGLSGELGAGKTAFVKEVARQLGVTASVRSPTFTVAQSYPLSHDPFRTLVHIDAYRLAPSDLDTFGWGDAAADPKNLVLVEWPENLPGSATDAFPRMYFKVRGEGVRDITYDT